MKMQDEVESAGTSANTEPTEGTVSSSEGMNLVDLLALLADAASLDSKGIHPGTNNEGKNPLFPDSNSQSHPPLNPICTSLSHHNVSLEQTPVTTFNTQEPQGTSTFACQTGTTTNCRGKAISHFAPPMPDKTIREESRQVVRMQINVELEKNVPSTNSATPHDQELTLCTSCARKVVAAVTGIGSDMYGSCPKPAAGTVSSLEGMSFSDLLTLADAVSLRIKGIQLGGHGGDLKQTPTPKQREKKHQSKVITEGKAKKTRKPVILKPVQSKGKPTGKRKYVRKSCVRSLNLELSKQPGDGNAVIGNETVHIGTGIDVVEKTHQPKVITEGKAKKTRKPFIPKPVQSKGKPTGKWKYLRKSCERSLNLELSKQPGDGNAVLEDGTVHLGIGIDVVEKTHIAPGTYLPNTNPPGTKLNAKSRKNRERKGLVTTLGGREKTETKSSQNNSSNSETGNLTTGGGTKRKHSTTTDHADISHVNLIGVHYNGLHAYQRYWVQFPAVEKKRISDNARFCDYATPTTTRNCNILPNQFTRQLINSDLQTLADGERPTTSIDALVAEKMHASFKKRRTTRNNRKKLVISTLASTNQMHRGFLLNGNQPSWIMSLDAAGQKPLNYMQMMEALTKKVSHLDINVGGSSSHEQKALIPS